ncbi:MAG TPA: zinc ribbon domain-containing protein [Bryobacteraceae bacterium]|nr:zinc ribbon domain-containing protein [Bryobacteraceae bacterium]
MFCNHCGQEVQANQRFCGGCGNPAHPVPPPPQPYVSSAAGRVGRHVKGLAIFWMVLSALNLLKAGGRFFGARVIGHWGHDWFDDGGFGFPVGEILPAVLSTMGLISLVLAAVGFVVGFGLMERRPWARTLAIVVGIIALLHPILGTILGIYTLWVLLPGDAEAEYRGMSRP